MLKVVILSFVICGVVKGVPLGEETNEIKDETPDIFKNFNKCVSNGSMMEMVNCVASRMLKVVERATAEPVINILPGVKLVSDNSVTSRQAKDIKEESLPSNPEDKANKLAELLVNATNRFFTGKTLKIQMTKENMARALEEGRGKMKKMVGPWMLGLGATMVTMVPIMMGGLSLLAAKALMIGKMAFVISLILFVQYFFQGRNILPSWTNFGGYGGYSGGYGGYGTYGTNNIGGWQSSAQYPYARSLNVTPEEFAEKKSEETDLPYSSHQQSH